MFDNKFLVNNLKEGKFVLVQSSRYDRGGEEALQKEGGFGGGGDPFESFFGGGDPFASFFGGGGGREEREAARGADIVMNLQVWEQITIFFYVFTILDMLIHHDCHANPGQ